MLAELIKKDQNEAEYDIMMSIAPQILDSKHIFQQFYVFFENLVYSNETQKLRYAYHLNNPDLPEYSSEKNVTTVLNMKNLPLL